MQFSFSPFPTLHTQRLVLRQITDEDAPAMLALRSSDIVMQYIDRPRAVTIDDAMTFIDRIKEGIITNSGITWAIALKEDPALQMAGTIGFWRIDAANYRAEIGYMLHPGHFRKGITQEALQKVLQYGFTTLKLHSVEANINPANHASAALLEKNGFAIEAHFKENYYFNGKFLDSIIYSLLTPISQ